MSRQDKNEKGVELCWYFLLFNDKIKMLEIPLSVLCEFVENKLYSKQEKHGRHTKSRKHAEEEQGRGKICRLNMSIPGRVGRPSFDDLNTCAIVHLCRVDAGVVSVGSPL